MRSVTSPRVSRSRARIGSSTFPRKWKSKCIRDPRCRRGYRSVGRRAQQPVLQERSLAFARGAGALALPARIAVYPREAGVRRLRRGVFRARPPVLACAEALMQKIHRELKYAPGETNIAAPLAEVLRTGGACARTFAHLMIACLRSRGLARTARARTTYERAPRCCVARARAGEAGSSASAHERPSSPAQDLPSEQQREAGCRPDAPTAATPRLGPASS